MGAAKFLRFHSLQLFYFYLFRKQFHPWRATWRHDNWVLPNSSVAISGNYFTFIFSENLHPWRATWRHDNWVLPKLLRCHCWLWSFPKTISSLKSDLPSRQLGGAKLLRASKLPFLSITLLSSFPETSSSVKSDLTSRQLGAAKLLRCHCWLWSFPKTIPSVKSDLPSRQLGAAHEEIWLSANLFRKQFHPWRATWRHDNWVLPNFYVAISGYDLSRKQFHPWRATSENAKFGEERLDVTTTGCCQISRCHFWQLFYFYLFRKQFHPWRATWRHDNWVLPNFYVAISGYDPLLAITLLLYFPKTSSSVKSDLTSRQLGAAKLLRCHFWLWSFPKTISRATWRRWNAAKISTLPFLAMIFSENNFIRESNLTSRQLGAANFYVAISGNYFTFIFSGNIFIREERLDVTDVTTTGCCQTSTLPLLAMIFSENNSIREERLAVTTTGWCQASTLPFLSITLLSSFPKTISSVKSDLTSRQPGAAKLLRCHFWLWSFPKTISSVKSNLTSRQLGAAKLLRCHFAITLLLKLLHPWRATWRHDNWVLPNFYVAISGYDLFRKQFHPSRATWRHDNWELPNFYVAISGYDLFRKHFHPWRATWRHDNWVLPDFYVAISGNYFTFIFSGNIFIREERLDVTTTGCCQTSTLPLLAMIFSKNNSFSVKSELPSRQLGGAKLLRCHFCQLLYFHLFRKQFHPWRATWRHDNRVLPNFSVAISLNYFTFISPENNFIPEERLDVTLSGCCQISSFPILAIILLLPFPKTISSMKSNLTSRQLGAAKLLRCHFWQLLYFYLFRKQFHSWRATWRHDNWVLPSFSVAISGNYFTFIFSENNFVGEERLDVTTTGCCQTSTLPFLAITLLLSFPKTSSSVKSDLTSRQLGAAKFLRCHFWLWSFPKTISSVKSNLTSRQLGAAKLLRCHFWLWSYPKTFSSVKSNLTSRQLGAARLLRCHIWQLLYFIFSGNNFIREERLDVTTTGCCQTSTLPLLAMIFSENNSIHEERLAVTTTGWCQASTLPFLSITLLSSFPKTISSVKSDLTSRQLGAAKLLRCHF